MTTKTKIILVIIGVLIAAIIYLQFSLQSTKKELAKKQLEAKINLQNFEAYKDSATMIARTLQEYIIAVKNLQQENKHLKDKNIYLRTQFKILLDSINVINKPAVIDTSNVDSNKIVITFEGKEGRISYKGQVIYFKMTKEATHSLKINQDPIKIVSILFLDKNTNLLKNQIYADGVLIDNAYTEIDSSIYTKLNSPEGVVDVAMNFWDTISFIIEANQEVIYSKDVEQWKQNRTSLNLGVGYNLNRNLSFEIKRDILNEIWQGSIRYSITLGSIWKLIF